MTDNLDEKATLLFVDDEESILKSLKRLMKSVDAQCLFSSSGAEALALFEIEKIDIVISDMKMPQMNGHEFLAQVAARYPETIRIMLTGCSGIDTVIGAINDGRVWGYIQKPWDSSQLLLTLDQALLTRNLMLERYLLQRMVNQYEQFSKSHYEGFIGDSSAMQLVYHTIELAAPSNASIFITGASGTGKEIAARAIHATSQRNEQAFVALNCAAIPRDLLESEIFGHIKGAFSGAVSHREGAASKANGGTLFLDELAEMDIALQSKLLRFIQTGSFQKVGSDKLESVDIRYICATNQNPHKAIEQAQLREDLFYRLNVISIELPPLKGRGWDAMLLASHFLSVFSKQENKKFLGFSKEAEKLILKYPWPGNVRQLENCIHSVVILSVGPMVRVEELNIPLRLPEEELRHYQSKTILERQPLGTGSTSLELLPNEIKPLSRVERDAIETGLAYCDGNVVKAAALLDVSPSTLYRKIQSWSDSAA